MCICSSDRFSAAVLAGLGSGVFRQQHAVCVVAPFHLNQGFKPTRSVILLSCTKSSFCCCSCVHPCGNLAKLLGSTEKPGVIDKGCECPLVFPQDVSMGNLKNQKTNYFPSSSNSDIQKLPPNVLM